MKRILMAMAALFLVAGLSACGMNKDNNANNTDNGTGTTDNNAGMNDNNTNVDNNDNAMGNNNDNAMGDNHDLSRDKDVAAKVETVDGVKGATVLMTANNAYVGVDLDNGKDETEDLKTKIRDEVKKVKPEIANVYVSADPDFSKQMSDYGKKIDEGEPVEGFFQEFSDAMKRMFPDSK
ncbi:YhcN/YlaJ family sporulation lipoprotein [Bhargavaea ullalensis]|uniref:YhcN/YlaJ family sporulation lipoprotein n=1 Tax=Bhargavaea ullalensis TaxID=1265685 RepID=A0ABV2GDX5_9BACL